MANPLAWTERGRIYGRSQTVQMIFDVSRETINQWVKKKGMPFLGKGRSTKYDLKKVVEWKINLETNEILDGVGKVAGDDDMDFSDLPVEMLNHKIKAYAAKKLKHESSIKEIQEKVEKGKYIPADRVDYNMAQVAGEFISILKELRQVLPVKLKNKSAEMIEEQLDEYFDELVTRIRKSAENV